MTDDPTYTLTLAASDVKFLRKLVRTELGRHRRSAAKLIEKFPDTDAERLEQREAFMLDLYELLGGQWGRHEGGRPGPVPRAEK